MKLQGAPLLSACFLLLALPSFASASSLVWGDQNGGSPAQVEIFDGGTYAAPLSVPAKVYLDYSGNPNVFGLFAELYRVTGSGDSQTRELLTTIYLHDPLGDDTTFTWPATGTYELEIFEIPPPFLIFEDKLKRFIAHLFLADVAYAQFDPPTLVETLHFTIQDAPTTAPLTPVIIIPGILGSAQHNGEWLIDPITHAYDNLIDTLAANGYEKDKTLFPFPYEWRVSNRTTATLLKAKIDEVKAICHCNQVDIVAHSMGGLVARSYIQSNDYAHDVRKLIFLGTPHLGAPKAYLMWEGGKSDINFEDKIVQSLLTTEALEHRYTNLFDYIRATPIPSVQELLPVYDYIKHVGSPTIPSFPNNSWYPNNLFLSDLKNTVANLYSSGVAISNFVGQLTASTTITTVRVIAPKTTSPTLLWGFGYPQGFPSTGDAGLERGQGDKTVPLSSASFINENLKIFNSEHTSLPTIAEKEVFKELTDKDAVTLVTGEDTLDVPILILQILSPADIVVVAPNGLKVGKDFGTNGEFNQIPDAFYSGFGTDDEYVTIPNPLNGPYKVITQGIGAGGAYTIAADLITSATSSEKFFTGLTQPNLITEHNVDVGTSGPGAIVKSIQIVATVSSIQTDVNSAYAFGWIKSKKFKDAFLKRLARVAQLKKQRDRIVAYKDMLEDLQDAREDHDINRQAYQLLTADINWLINH